MPSSRRCSHARCHWCYANSSQALPCGSFMQSGSLASPSLYVHHTHANVTTLLWRENVGAAYGQARAGNHKENSAFHPWESTVDPHVQNDLRLNTGLYILADSIMGLCTGSGQPWGEPLLQNKDASMAVSNKERKPTIPHSALQMEPSCEGHASYRLTALACYTRKKCCFISDTCEPSGRYGLGSSVAVPKTIFIFSTEAIPAKTVRPSMQ